MKYRIIHTWKTRPDGSRYDETYVPQRRSWFGLWFTLPDFGYYPNAHVSEKDCAQNVIDLLIAYEQRAKDQTQREILEYP